MIHAEQPVGYRSHFAVLSFHQTEFRRDPVLLEPLVGKSSVSLHIISLVAEFLSMSVGAC